MGLGVTSLGVNNNVVFALITLLIVFPADNVRMFPDILPTVVESSPAIVKTVDVGYVSIVGSPP